MRANADTIWQVPAYLPYLQPPLTAESFAAAEKTIGFKLPEQFLNLLRKQNGGYIRFSLPEMLHDTIAGIGPNFPSLTQFDWEECQEYVSFPLKGLVPFDGDGHWHLCLDYRRNSTSPAITYIDVECDAESPVANSFVNYLAMLRIDSERELVLEGIADIEKAKTDLASALHTVFEPPDTYGQGYPVHGARMGTDDEPECIWIAPNTVPRGFVRSDDPRYDELKDLMPGSCSQFPEAPPSSYILTASDGVREKVVEACARLRIVARPLSEYLKSS